MRRIPFGAVAGTVLLASATAWADRGALSLDLGGGATALRVAAPYVVNPSSTWGVAPSLNIGLRYAWTNVLELSLSGFYELPVHYTHANVSVEPPDSGPLPGTLSHDLARFGFTIGLRYVFGTILRPFVGLEGGWSHRAYSAVHHVNTNVQPNQDYGLALSDFGTDNILLQPVLGLEWAFADRASASVIARVPILLGPEATFGFSASLLFSYSWYL
jgi:hypothetical protein